MHTTDNITICQIFVAIPKINLKIEHVQEKSENFWPRVYKGVAFFFIKVSLNWNKTFSC